MTTPNLDKLVAWMRGAGVTSISMPADQLGGREGAVSIVLGREPAPPPLPPAEPPTDAEMAAAFAVEQRRLESLLFASSEGFPPDFDDEGD